MTDYATVGDTPDANGGSGDPYQIAAWINGAASRVAQGQALDHSGQWDPAHGKFGVPLGYGVENGRLVQDTQTWSSIYKGLLGTAGFATLGLLIGPTMGATSPTLEATMNAEAAAGAAGPLAGAETGVAATTAATAPPSSIAASGASSVPAWLRPAISAAAPFAIRAATGGGGSGSGGNGLDPEQNSLLTQLIKMSMTRQQESAPVHQAAMTLAGNLAPQGSWSDSPRFQDAVAQTGGPGPTTPTNPSIAAAYAKLMGGR